MEKNSEIYFVPASNDDIQKGLALMGKSFSKKLDFNFVNWIDETSNVKPQMVVAKKDDDVTGTIYAYPERCRIKKNKIQNPGMMGQFCISPQFRKLGIGFDLYTNGENIFRNFKSPLYCGIAGKNIFNKYYKPRFCYIKAPFETSVFTFHDTKHYLYLFCKKYNQIGAKLSDAMVIEIEDFVWGNHLLKFSRTKVKIIKSINRSPDLLLKGPAGLLFKFIVTKSGKKKMISALVTLSFRLTGGLKHPIKYYHFLKLLICEAKQ